MLNPFAKRTARHNVENKPITTTNYCSTITNRDKNKTKTKSQEYRRLWQKCVHAAHNEIYIEKKKQMPITNFASAFAETILCVCLQREYHWSYYIYCDMIPNPEHVYTNVHPKNINVHHTKKKTTERRWRQQ